MRKRKLEEIKNELFTDKFDNKDSVKIFASLNNPDVQKDIIRNLMKPKSQSDDNFIEKCVNMILMAVRQKKIRLLQEIDLSYENENYPYPPMVKILNNGKEINCDFGKKNLKNFNMNWIPYPPMSTYQLMVIAIQ